MVGEFRMMSIIAALGEFFGIVGLFCISNPSSEDDSLNKGCNKSVDQTLALRVAKLTLRLSA